MILLESSEISIHGRHSPIVRWEVWFMTPKGLCTALSEAVTMCSENDWPLTMIRPVPVAIDSRDNYEVSP